MQVTVDMYSISFYISRTWIFLFSFSFFLIVFLVFILGPYPAVLRDYSLLRNNYWLELENNMGCRGLKLDCLCPRQNTLPIVLLFQHLKNFFLIYKLKISQIINEVIKICNMQLTRDCTLFNLSNTISSHCIKFF